MQSIHYKSSQIYEVEIRVTGWLNFKKVKEKGRQFCIKIKSYGIFVMQQCM